MSTIVMRVDLDCDKCYKKIRKALCKIQDKVTIRSINFDEKAKAVTISGPFDAEEVADRLTSIAGKVITDMHVAAAGGGQMHVAGGGGGHKYAPNNKQGKADGLFGFGGHKHQDKGHGGFGGGDHKHQEKGHGGFGGGHKHQDKGHVGKQEVKVHGGGYGGGKQEKNGGFGGKPEKKHVKFDFDDMSDDDDFDDLPAHGHHGGHGGNGKPKIVHTSTPVAARLDEPRTGPPMSMAAAAAPMRMPGPGMMMMPPQPQALATPSIWPPPTAAPDWGYSAPSQYGYYGAPAAYGYGGYGATPAYGYGRSGPYGVPPQYYEEEPSAGCTIL